MKKFNIKRYLNAADNSLEDKLVISNLYLIEKKKEVIEKL